MTPDRTLSDNLGDMADRLGPYVTGGATLEAPAVMAMIVLLLQCRILAAALEQIAADHDANLKMARDLERDLERPEPAGEVVDISRFIRRPSAAVLQFPGGAS